MGWSKGRRSISMSEIALGKDGAPADGPGYVFIPGWAPVCWEDQKNEPVTPNLASLASSLQKEVRFMVQADMVGRVLTNTHSWIQSSNRSPCVTTMLGLWATECAVDVAYRWYVAQHLLELKQDVWATVFIIGNNKHFTFLYYFVILSNWESK